MDARSDGRPIWDGVRVDDELVRHLLDQAMEGAYCVNLDRKVLFWNRAAERLTGYAPADIVGRNCDAGVLEHVDGEGNRLCQGRCPLAATMETGASQEAVIYLHHRKGHRQAVRVRVVPVRDAAGQVVGAVEFFDEASPAPDRLERLERLAYTDPLTGLPNRRYLERVLESRRADLARFGWAFGVMVVDVDGFKPINDTFGHAVGDKVLRMVGASLTAGLRPADTVGRIGGDEFVAVITAVTPAALVAMANRLRALVDASSLGAEDGRAHVTVSIGATMARPDDTVASMLARADALLYRSKESGRNRVSDDITPAASP